MDIEQYGSCCFLRGERVSTPGFKEGVKPLRYYLCQTKFCAKLEFSEGNFGTPWWDLQAYTLLDREDMPKNRAIMTKIPLSPDILFVSTGMAHEITKKNIYPLFKFQLQLTTDYYIEAVHYWLRARKNTKRWQQKCSCIPVQTIAKYEQNVLTTLYTQHFP